jgi:hypothetical protein
MPIKLAKMDLARGLKGETQMIRPSVSSYRRGRSLKKAAEDHSKNGTSQRPDPCATLDDFSHLLMGG